MNINFGRKKQYVFGLVNFIKINKNPKINSSDSPKIFPKLWSLIKNMIR